MELLGRITYGRLALIGAAVAAVFIMGHFAQAPALAEEEAQMSVSVSGCSAAECNLDPGEAFTVTVSVDDAPDAGYVLVQSFVDYGTDLTYNMTASPSDEVVWPDAIGDVIVRDSVSPGTVLHGGLTGVIPPLPLSTYTGTVFELAFECSDSFSSNNIQLLPSGDPVAGTSGALLSTGEDVQVIPKVNSVTVNCGEAPDEPDEPDEPTSTQVPDQPTDGGLPSSGSGALSTGDAGSSAALWLMIAALAAIGLSLGTFGWRAARNR